MQTESSKPLKAAADDSLHGLDHHLNQLAVDGYTVIEQLIPGQLLQRISNAAKVLNILYLSLKIRH